MLSAVPQLHGHRFVLLVNVTRPHVVPRAEVAVPQGPNDRSRHDGMCLPQVSRQNQALVLQRQKALPVPRHATARHSNPIGGVVTSPIGRSSRRKSVAL